MGGSRKTKAELLSELEALRTRVTNLQKAQIERSCMEESLRESEELHRSVLDSISDTVFMTNDDGEFTYICPNVATIFGYSVQEVESFGNIRELLGEGLFGSVALEESGEIRNMERSVTDKDGMSHVLLINAKRVSIKRGTVLYTCRDITERKQAEKEVNDALGESQKRAAETEALLKSSRAVLEYQDFATASRKIFDSCKYLIGAAAGYIALLSDDGTENDVLFLDSGGLPCTVDPNLPMPVRGLRAEAYRSKKPVYENAFRESAWTEFLPSGHVQMDNVMFAPLLLRGRAVGVMGLANKSGGFTDDDARLTAAFADHAAIAFQNSRNLEALRKSETRYRSLSESLEMTVRKKVAELRQAESLAAIGRLISVVAHEFRNPLQNIRMGVDTIRKELGEDAYKLEILEEINHGINSLNGIVRELLDYSKPVQLDYSSWPVREIVGQALNVVRDQLHNITIQLELEQENQEISVDVAKINRLLLNLISNAAEAMSGGGTLRIRSQFSREEGATVLLLSVSDTGSGVDEGNLERIQEPFFTTKNQGTGLGLPICKKIVEAHGGTMSIESKVNRGTTVTVTLPTSSSS